MGLVSIWIYSKKSKQSQDSKTIQDIRTFSFFLKWRRVKRKEILPRPSNWWYLILSTSIYSTSGFLELHLFLFQKTPPQKSCPKFVERKHTNPLWCERPQPFPKLPGQYRRAPLDYQGLGGQGGWVVEGVSTKMWRQMKHRDWNRWFLDEVWHGMTVAVCVKWWNDIITMWPTRIIKINGKVSLKYHVSFGQMNGWDANDVHVIIYIWE